MKTELDLLHYFKKHSCGEVLDFTYEKFLEDANAEVISITSAYLYEKLFLDKDKGINYVQKLGYNFFNPEIRNSDEKLPSDQVLKVDEAEEAKSNRLDDSIDFFLSLEDTEEFLEIKDEDIIDPESNFENNEVFFKELYEEPENESETIEQLMTANQKLVIKIASKYEKVVENSILDLDDLISSGNNGLYTAIRKFDPELGYKFSTYATHWIRQKITRDIADYRLTIRLPVHLHEKLNKVRRVMRESMNENLTEQIRFCVERLDMSEQKLLELIYIDKQFNSGITSLQHLVGDGDDTELENFVESSQILYGDVVKTPDQALLSTSIRQDIEKVMNNTLNDRERDIIKQRLGWDNGEEKTLEAVGQEKGLTRERIRQIEKKSLNKLKGQFMRYKINEYLEEYNR